MKFSAIRHGFFVVHLWVGLTLGVLCAVLGLTGSFLVYDDVVTRLTDPPPFATTQGSVLPLAMVADAARQAASEKGVAPGQLRITLPKKPAEAVAIRVSEATPAGTPPRRGGGLQVYVDPVSGQVLQTRTQTGPAYVQFLHRLHGSFLLGREGRSILVGGLGVAMLVLGVTGLLLWWPRRGQWKYAFFVRPTAQGLRFHRELHAAAGIWIFVVYMIVSYSGLVISWPQLLGPARQVTKDAPLTPGTTAAIGPDRALALAKVALPGTEPDSVTLPGHADQPITVGFLIRDALRASVLVDPWNDKVIAVRNNSSSVLAWMRPLHEGLGLGVVWRFLVFLSGLVPTLFVVTGIIMWLKKRRRHVPMTATFDEVGDAAGEEA